MIHRPLRRAFTLIELLVVISIVTLLISILLPALGAARRTAQAAACKSNLRQLGIGLTSYSVDNNDSLLPSYSLWDAPWGLGNMYWHQRLMQDGLAVGENTPEDNNAVCPSDVEPWKPYTFSDQEKLIYNTSYGANPVVMIVDSNRDGRHDWGFWPYDGAVARFADLLKASELVLLSEVTYDFYFEPWSPNTNLPNGPGEWDWSRHAPYDGVSGGLVNMLHGDLHVSTTKSNDAVAGLSEPDVDLARRRILAKP